MTVRVIARHARLLGMPCMILMLTAAYIDPGVGALIWQVIASAVVGSLVLFRRQLAGLRRLIKRIGETRSPEK